MLSSRGFNCVISKATQLIDKMGKIYWLCQISVKKRINKYWGYKGKDGIWKPYLEFWDSTSFYTDRLIAEGDEIRVVEFTIGKYIKKTNDFDKKGVIKYPIKVYSFVNNTKGYAVCQKDKKRKRGTKITEVEISTVNIPEYIEPTTTEEEMNIQPFIAEENT